MLLKFGARNFTSFREGVEISLVLPANCPKSISKGEKISNLLSIQGANGSGKTCVLKIISFLSSFCTNSFAAKPEEEIFVEPFFHNDDDPIELYCDFEADGTGYSYYLSVKRTHVIEESLHRIKKRQSLMFRRKDNELLTTKAEFTDLKKIPILRSNASILSSAYQHQISSTAIIYEFFDKITSNVSWRGRESSNPFNYHSVSKYYHDTPLALKFTKNILKKSDIGIGNLSISKRKDEEGDDVFFPVFHHDTSAEVQSNKLTFFDESSGTRELFLILPLYNHVLRTGGVLVLDEFDVNLHPDILPSLIALFEDKKINKNNAQMIFTTHNDNIMDIMGKYRITLLNKDKCESYAYRLDEIPGDILNLRNDRSILRVYNEGKIGGVPRL